MYSVICVAFNHPEVVYSSSGQTVFNTYDEAEKVMTKLIKQSCDPSWYYIVKLERM